MNIGIVTSWFERGAAYVSRAFMQSLQELGHDVRIFVRGGEAYDRGPEWNFPNVHYSASPMGSSERCPYTGIADVDEFTGWLTTHRLDVVMFNEQMDARPMEECRTRRIKTIFFGLGYAMPLDFYRAHFDLIIAHTKITYDVFEPTGIAHLVRWGVDLATLSPGGKNLTTDPVIFFHNAGMSFGNLRKGTHRLIKAWSRLPKGEKDAARVLIHSQRDLDVLYRQAPDVEPIIRRDATIEFFIGTSRPPWGYHQGNVYVYPASVDSIGLTVAEAMACGMPVLTTAASPWDEFVVDDFNGLLARARRRSWSDTLGSRDKDARYGCYDVTIDDLADKLRYFIRHRERIVEMGANSRRRAEEHFDFKKNVELFDALLRAL